VKDEAAFNTLSILLEIVLFTGMVGTALAVRFGKRGRKAEPAAESVPVKPAVAAVPQTWSGEMTPEELAERRHQMMNVAYAVGVVVVSGVVAVAVYFWRHRGR